MEYRLYNVTNINNEELTKALDIWFIKREFNIPLQEDETTIRPVFLDRPVFIPTKKEVELVASLILEGKEIEEKTKQVLQNNGVGGFYALAVEKLSDIWSEIIEKGGKRKAGDALLKELKEATDVVYGYRGQADLFDLELGVAREEWMQRHPMSRNKFARYADKVRIGKDCSVFEHLRLLTPAWLGSLMANNESYEDFKFRKEDAEEVNRDDWFDVDYRAVKREEKGQDAVERTVVKAFSKWLGVSKYEGSITDVACLVQASIEGGNDYTILSYGKIVENILNFCGEPGYFPQIMGTKAIVDKYYELKSQEEDYAASWKSCKNLQELKFGLSILKKGVQKDLDWAQLGGKYKKTCGAILRYECSAEVPEDIVQLCKNVTSWDDGVKDKNGNYLSQPTINSYLGAKAKIFEGAWDSATRTKKYFLRSKKAVGYAEGYQNFLNKLAARLVLHNKYFAKALCLVAENSLILPGGKEDQWNKALMAAIPDALAIRNKVIENVVVTHRYEDLEEDYGKFFAKENAIKILQAWKKDALKSVEEESSYIGDREVIQGGLADESAQALDLD